MISINVGFLFVAIFVAATQAMVGPKCPFNKEAGENMQTLAAGCPKDSPVDQYICISKSSQLISEDESSYDLDKILSTFHAMEVDDETLAAIRDKVRSCASSEGEDVRKFVQCSLTEMAKICN